MTVISDIVARVGGQVTHGGCQALVPGPGHSPRDRSMHLELGDAERVLWFAHCGCGHGHRQVMAYLGLSEDTPDLRPSERLLARHRRADEAEVTDAAKQAFCAALWAASKPLKGTLPIRYLANRAITLANPPPVLRYHPAAPRGYPDPSRPMRTAPAMLALVQNRAGDPIGLHVTFIAPDATAHDGRVMFGSIRGGAVRLTDVAPELAVAEGLESSLSYMDLQGRPCWSLLSTSQFKSFIPPRGVRMLYVAPDMDDKLGTSLDLCQGMVGKFERVKVVVDAPPKGTDWNSHARALLQA